MPGIFSSPKEPNVPAPPSAPTVNTAANAADAADKAAASGGMTYASTLLTGVADTSQSSVAKNPLLGGA